MKQIVTLEKEIAFKTMVGEISSISLEPDLSFINDSEIEGNLIISGTYKMTEASTLEEEFNYKVPVEIMLTTSLLEDKRKVDINNFTYGIVNEEALEVKVEILIEGLEKIDIKEDEEESETIEGVNTKEEEPIEVRESNSKEEIEVLTTEEESLEDLNSFGDNDALPSLNDVTVKEEIPVMAEADVTVLQEDTTDSNQVMNSIFESFANTDETYATYSVYILREDDNLEEVIAKYKTNREILAEYNDLDNLKVGSKLIIPMALEVND